MAEHMQLWKYFKGYLVIHGTDWFSAHFNADLGCAWLISAVNIWGIKCDKVVDFPKSGHKYQPYLCSVVAYYSSQHVVTIK